MACNCKRGLEIQDKYGVKEEESFVEKSYRLLWKVVIFFIIIALGVVVTPIVIIVVIYNFFFGKNKGIVFPTQLAKYLK
jgi:hypothetical protein